MSFKEYLETIVNGTDLTHDQAKDALNQLISGEVPSEQVAGFLFGMRAKGETVPEMTAFVEVMREAAVPVDVNVEGAIDLCGTGGDHANTFNISTAAMFVVAGAGVPVLKHGNRSVSSKSGSADVLESLGAVPALSAGKVGECFKETNMGFMFAPYFHPVMKHVMPARKGLGMRTFFNVLGPLLNPAKVRRQMIGSFSKNIARQIIHILHNLDTEFAYTVNAVDGLDEVTLTDYSEIFELNNNVVSESFRFDPRSMGFSWIEEQDIKGGDAEHNAGIIRNLVKNKATEAQEGIVLLNATFGIHASGKVGHLEEALEMAKDSLKSGGAEQALNRFAEVTSELQGKED